MRRFVLAFVMCTAITCGCADGEDERKPSARTVAPQARGPARPFDDLRARPGKAAGQVILEFTPPRGADGSLARGYEARAQVRHLTAGNVAKAPVVARWDPPRLPAAPQRLTVSGLEPGRTLQFALRAILSSGPGPYSAGVGCHVPGAPHRAPPANAIRVTAPGKLDKDGAYYLLVKDVRTLGTAFRVTGRDVTLDLGGHTITYGAQRPDTHAVYGASLYRRGTTTILNGRIRQSGEQPKCDGVHLRGAQDVRLSGLDIQVRGPDSNGISIWDGLSGNLRIDHCTIRCDTKKVTDRHYPGVGAILVEGADQGVEIDQNEILSSPQWGIRVSAEKTTGAFLIHHNRIAGTKALVANGYMIGVHKPAAVVFENLLHGQSRGIHIDGIDGHGHGAQVHDNCIRAQDQPNPEFPKHWCHGIKVEGASGVSIHHNRVLVRADERHSEARALDLSCDKRGRLSVTENWIAGLSSDAKKIGQAVHWTDGTIAPAKRLLVFNNVFVATDRFVARAWESGMGGPFVQNAWIRDHSKKTEREFVFERFDNRDAAQSRGHGFRDPVTSERTTVASQWISPGPYESNRDWTFLVRVTDDAVKPLKGARVSVREKEGGQVLGKTTDAKGVVRGVVTVFRITNGPKVAYRGPFTLSVTHTGLPDLERAFSPLGPLAVLVRLPSGKVVQDRTVPKGPKQINARALSASRARVAWTPGRDEVGVAAYLVYLEGEVAAVTPATECTLGGLTPGSTYVVGVQAVDFAGNRSPITTPMRFTTPAEDRGP